jgi:hypothetical protein
LILLAMAPSSVSQDPVPCTVRGTLPAGSQLEFRAPGSPDRKSATAGEKGQYSLLLDPGRYEIIWVRANGKKFSDTVWLSGAEVRLNAEAGAESGGGLRLDGGAATNASAQEYDLLADWRVIGHDGQGAGPSQLTMEAELNNGRTENLTVWALSSLGDDEKETAGPLVTTPDGRILFRVRDNRMRPDRVVALRISVRLPGGETVTRRITPVLEFSASGHLHAIYPDDLTLSAKP